MIKEFHHKGVERFFAQGTLTGIRPGHAERLRLQLARLDDASTPQDMNARNWRLHADQDFWAVWVDDKWRLAFRFEGENAVFLDYRKHNKEP